MDTRLGLLSWSVEMQQLAMEELQSMVVDFLSLVDSPTLLG
jgi:hypothetical protein